MKCLLSHNWSWPRKRGSKDMQVCLDCGLERESKVRFDGPRYHRTQDPIPDFATTALYSGPERRKRHEVTPITAAAA